MRVEQLYSCNLINLHTVNSRYAMKRLTLKSDWSHSLVHSLMSTFGNALALVGEVKGRGVCEIMVINLLFV